MHPSSASVQDLKPESHAWLYIMAIKGLSSSYKDKPLHYAAERNFQGPTKWCFFFCGLNICVGFSCKWSGFFPQSRHMFWNSGAVFPVDESVNWILGAGVSGWFSHLLQTEIYLLYVVAGKTSIKKKISKFICSKRQVQAQGSVCNKLFCVL